VMMIVLAARWLSDPRPEAAQTGRWLESARRAALASTGTGEAGSPAEAGRGEAGTGDAGSASRTILASADVDSDDAALAAYNAMLARLAEADRPGRTPPPGPPGRR